MMDGPAMTHFVLTGFLAAGVHLVLNTCGAGAANAMPFVVGADAPPPILPVLKITASSDHFRRRSTALISTRAAFLPARNRLTSPPLACSAASSPSPPLPHPH